MWPFSSKNKCPTCKGKTKVRLPPDGRKVQCPYCRGTGRNPFPQQKKRT